MNASEMQVGRHYYIGALRSAGGCVVEAIRPVKIHGEHGMQVQPYVDTIRSSSEPLTPVMLFGDWEIIPFDEYGA